MFRKSFCAAVFATAAFVIGVLGGPAPGIASAAPGAPAATVSAQVAAVSPDSLTVLWRLDLAPGWHVYGPFRNDSGYAPSFALELPEGWSAGSPRWPVPERHVAAGEILDHVYHGVLQVPQVLHRPAGATAPRLEARVAWLECNEICIPRDTTLTVDLAAEVAPATARQLATVLAALPGPLPADAVRVTRTPEFVEIVAPGATAITAIPGESGPFLADLIADGTVAGERLRLGLRPGSRPRDDGSLNLLLVIEHGPAQRTAGSITVPPAQSATQEASP
jgi:DsbC/DsbD-like thiol-disulfide interchange protein